MQTANINSDQNTQHAEFLSDAHFNVKILFSSDEPAKLGKQYAFSTADTSKNEIYINSKETVVINSVLDLCITDNHSKDKFFVTADVKKCKANSSSSDYTIKLQLKNRTHTHTDLDKWLQLIKIIK